MFPYGVSFCALCAAQLASSQDRLPNSGGLTTETEGLVNRNKKVEMNFNSRLFILRIVLVLLLSLIDGRREEERHELSRGLRTRDSQMVILLPDRRFRSRTVGAYLAGYR